MTNAYYIVLLFIVPMGLFVGIVMMPRWFAQSMCKHRLWALRDKVADDVIGGRLPYEHDAVQHLANRLEFVVHDMTRVHIVDMWAWKRAMRDAGPEVRAVAEMPRLAGLTENQRDLVCRHREAMTMLTASMILTGSWLGIGYVFWFAAPRVIRVVVSGGLEHPAAAERDAELAIRRATREAVITTRLGQGLREFVRYEVEQTKPAAVAA